MMKVHFIAIGGSAMHNLAIALQKKDYEITGSDDEIFEPSKSKLKKYNILPEKEGWFPDKITKDIDAIILGMHARDDNPELLKAQELGLRIYSYPEYLYEQSRNKIRVVIGGSHGKTTITAMILHTLNYFNIDCDYMIGAQLEGFEVMVKLSDKAKIMLIEGDEYLTSPIDRRPKFHLYKPNIALLSGIAWDHINVFPTYDFYLEQFEIFVNLIEDDGTLVYCEDDREVKNIAISSKGTIKKLSYSLPPNKIENGVTYIKYKDKWISLKVFGEHNLKNINGARLVCNELEISDKQFYETIISYKGASKRLELIDKNDSTFIYKDFAHSPSKLKATVKALKEQFPEKELVACIELHTFSSLNKDFIELYNGCMEAADLPFVYFNPHTIELKKLPVITKEQVKNAFNNQKLKVYTDSSELFQDLLAMEWNNRNLLLMSSGNFDGIDFDNIARKILKK